MMLHQYSKEVKYLIFQYIKYVLGPVYTFFIIGQLNPSAATVRSGPIKGL